MLVIKQLTITVIFDDTRQLVNLESDLYTLNFNDPFHVVMTMYALVLALAVIHNANNCSQLLGKEVSDIGTLFSQAIQTKLI